MTIDEASVALLQGIAAANPPSTGPVDVNELRASLAGLIDLQGPGPQMHAVTDEVVTRPDGSFPVRVLVPSPSPRGVVVYYHGGGWVIGDIPQFDVLGRALAERANVTVVLVGYRLAPEHPFPTPVEDAHAALRWVVERATPLPGGRGPIVLAGDSAGGNLAIVTALAARAQGPTVDAALLAYPATDWDPSRTSYSAPENQLLLTQEDMNWFIDQYAPEELRKDPRISPLQDPDLTGFPPTALALAEFDPLREEGELFGERLRDADVPVQQRLFEQQMHGFVQMTGILPASTVAIDWFADFLDTTVFPTARTETQEER